MMLSVAKDVSALLTLSIGHSRASGFLIGPAAQRPRVSRKMSLFHRVFACQTLAARAADVFSGAVSRFEALSIQACAWP